MAIEKFQVIVMMLVLNHRCRLNGGNMTTLASLLHNSSNSAYRYPGDRQMGLLGLKASARRLAVTLLPVMSIIASLVAAYGIAQLS